MSEPGRPATDYGLPDDEIVAEIPVFLTEKIGKNLHLLQYPLKAGSIGPGELRPSTARIKPIHGQIEMDIPLDVTSPMYNRERGQELGIGLSDSGRLLDIQTIVSVDIPKSSTYLAGVLKNRELHLTPIEKITQLRPSLKYLDKVAEKERAASKLDYDDEDTKEEKQVQTVQVSVRSAQAEEALRQQQNSIASIQKRLEEEPWSSLTYYDIGSDESAAVSSQLVAANTEDLICKTDPSEYLTTIIGNTCPDVN
ncbi:hypothetical protein DL89DRAFT_255362 [Linderina pennispora]|uniref:DNA-directed RNA polymerase III subunit Rpc5 n=1 Tax=Linderina pennispora TaxID=61395 RepID=A0A1Y1WIC5_9FUNG|nr:uncharacterized protein DL89DRAFT_255362 [Linderina pennispora]ORX73253.1 hypothetical protein DL89DRAFT_255362 [Linderina pennispora]